MTRREPLRYNGRVVGFIEQRKGLTVFEWVQEPFEYFSDNRNLAYGMGRGLIEKLEDEEVDFIEMETEALIRPADVWNHELIYPYHDCFNNPPSEPQLVIKVSR